MNNKRTAIMEKMEQIGFQFDEATHIYLLDGKPLTGVTTILSCIAKPALIQWSADEAVKFLGWYNEKYVESDGLIEALDLNTKWEALKTLSAREFYAKLSEARVQHAKRKKAAGTTGTDVHAEIEYLVKDAIKNNGGFIKAIPNNNDNELVKKVVDKFVNWATENNITFLESEKRLYSREHWYAGTVDIVFLQDGRKHIGDIKTSSGIYGREFFFQMAGYQIALEEKGEKDIVVNTIIRCGKDGSFEVKDSFDTESDKAGFLAALALYRELNK